MKSILPDTRQYLTAIEYFRVQNQPGNVAQVDELLKILLTKEYNHFDGFCRTLEQNEYLPWAQQLRAATSSHTHAAGKHADLRTHASVLPFP